MTNVIIAVVIIAVLALAVFRICTKHKRGCCGSEEYKPRKKKLDYVDNKKTVSIEGMMCLHCENRVIDALNDIKGASAEVHWKKGTAVVSMDHPVSDEEIIAAVEHAGYKVTEIK